MRTLKSSIVNGTEISDAMGRFVARGFRMDQLKTSTADCLLRPCWAPSMNQFTGNKERDGATGKDCRSLFNLFSGF